MSDVTFGVKVSPETKEKVSAMIEASGMKSKEFFESLLSAYEMQRLKEGTADFGKDLSELEIHTNRINQIFAHAVHRATHEKQAIIQQIEGIKASKDEIILGYQQESNELKEQIKGHIEQAGQADKAYNEATKHVQQLEETNENNKALIGEYKEKIDTLTGLVSEYKGYSEENKQLKTTLSELHQENQQQRTKVNELTNELSRINEHNKVNLAKVNEQHKTELERLEERKGIEKERELLEVRTKYQEKAQKANEDYTAKIQALYEEINSLRKGSEKDK